ncbi:MAG: hypothetical protein AB1576_10920 [Bacillota bacterium]|jgi:hypothetical protein
MAELAKSRSLALSSKLQGFKDPVIAGGTLIRLHKNLAPRFLVPRVRPRGKDHANRAMGQGYNPLFDLGYFKYQLFSRITRNGGHFVSS